MVNQVSDRLRGEFENGRTYYPMHDKPLDVPEDVVLKPDSDFLRWHNDTVFRS